MDPTRALSPRSAGPRATPVSPPATRAQQLKCAFIHFAKAALTQGVAYGTVIVARMAARAIYDAWADPGQAEEGGDVTAAAVLLAGDLALTIAFDRLCTRRAIALTHEIVMKKDGLPPAPLSRGLEFVLSTLPSALTLSLVVRAAHEGEHPMILAVDIGAMCVGWRAGRLFRDGLQQGTAHRLPSTKVIDPELDKEIAGTSKKRFDEARLGWQIALYTFAVFWGATVLTPALRSQLGDDERANDKWERLAAMIAPAITSILVEGADELIGTLVQAAMARRQGLTIRVGETKRAPDVGTLILDHGAMRALMGLMVTDATQLILSASRGSDLVIATSVALGSIATSSMGMRGKSVQVGLKLALDGQEFRRLADELVAATASEMRRPITPSERTLLIKQLYSLAKAMDANGWKRELIIPRMAALTSTEIGQLAPRANMLPAVPETLSARERLPYAQAKLVKGLRAMKAGDPLRVDGAPATFKRFDAGYDYPLVVETKGVAPRQSVPVAEDVYRMEADPDQVKLPT